MDWLKRDLRGLRQSFALSPSRLAPYAAALHWCKAGGVAYAPDRVKALALFEECFEAVARMGDRAVARFLMLVIGSPQYKVISRRMPDSKPYQRWVKASGRKLRKLGDEVTGEYRLARMELDLTRRASPLP